MVGSRWHGGKTGRDATKGVLNLTIERFEQLEVWQGAHDLVLRVYDLTGGIPSEEKSGLVSQMRRAAVSVPANIAEGFKRRTRPDKVHFYNVA